MGGAEPSRRPLLPLLSLLLQDGEWRASNPASGGFAPVIISMLLYADSLISLAACVGISRCRSNMAVMPLKPWRLQRIHYGLLANMEGRGPFGALCRCWPEQPSGQEENRHASKQLILLCFLLYHPDVRLYSQILSVFSRRLFPRLSPPPIYSSLCVSFTVLISIFLIVIGFTIPASHSHPCFSSVSYSCSYSVVLDRMFPVKYDCILIQSLWNHFLEKLLF